MSTFVDTSGLLPLVDADNVAHTAVTRAWEALLLQGESVVTTSYVLLETFALAQSRLGVSAVRGLRDDLYPALTVEWVGVELHEAGVAALLAAGRRHLSLVDCVSFEVMRRLGITRAFALDMHFQERGFTLTPSPG